jgi:hypothetical protein
VTSLIELQYLPPIAYFSALQRSSEILIERHEHYVKQSYRNRCYINTVHGVVPLIVPLTAKHGKVLITDVRIDYGQKWLNNHWRTIRSAYGNAAFFEYYSDDLERVLFRKHIYLYDLNLELLSMCLKWLKRQVELKETLSYAKIPSMPVHDLRSVINPKKTEHLSRFYQPAPYKQVFGNAFAENLSLIDLIFCAGPEAAGIVELSSHSK